MPNGRVKVFHEKRNFGFLTAEDGRELFVSADDVEGGTLRSGDLVEYEVVEGDNGKKAGSVSVTKQAPEDNPIGRTMAPPPTWDELEAIDRERRAARRRRR